MAFAILRTAKLKSGGNIAASLQHAFRERETKNANKDVDNVILKGGNSVSEVNQSIQALTPEKHRKDAVRVIEVMITGSPEAFARHGGKMKDDTAYFDDALKYLEQKFGSDNVVSAMVHLDETTPHLSAFIVPRDGDKLNAKKWLGGRQKLSELQTDFAQKVAKKYDLQRGLAGSNSYHNDVKQFYAAIDKKPENIPPRPVKPVKPLTPKKPENYLIDKAKAFFTGNKSRELEQYELKLQKHASAQLKYERAVEVYKKDFNAFNNAMNADYNAAKAGARVRDFLTGRYKSVTKDLQEREKRVSSREKVSNELVAELSETRIKLQNVESRLSEFDAAEAERARAFAIEMQKRAAEQNRDEQVKKSRGYTPEL